MPIPSFLFVHPDDTRNRGQHQILSTGRTTVGGAGDSGDGTGAKGFNPLDVLIKNLSRRCFIAPGAGASLTCKLKDDSNAFLSSDIIIADSDTFVDVDVEATLPAVANAGSNAAIAAVQNWFNEWKSTAPAPVADPNPGYIAMEYQVPSVSGLSFYATGVDFGFMGFSGVQGYTPLAGAFQSNLTTRATAQVPWPVNGTLQYVALVWKGLAAGTSVEVALEKSNTIGTASAGDVIGPFTLSATSPTSNWQSIVNTLSTASVSAGEYLNWRLVRTAGAGTSFNCIFVVGFKAS